jgi:hypothetical protein
MKRRTWEGVTDEWTKTTTSEQHDVQLASHTATVVKPLDSSLKFATHSDYCANLGQSPRHQSLAKPRSVLELEMQVLLVQVVSA